MIGPLRDQPVMGSVFAAALDARFHERHAVTLDVAQRRMWLGPVAAASPFDSSHSRL
jgi:hypothetical protein